MRKGPGESSWAFLFWTLVAIGCHWERFSISTLVNHRKRLAADALLAMDIWTLPLEGDGTAQPFVATEVARLGPVFSPDGRAIAYLDASDGFQLYVRPYPTTDATVRRVPVDSSSPPTWYPDGGELVFQNLGNGMISAVEVATQPTLTLGPVAELFSQGTVRPFISASGPVFSPLGPVPGRRLIVARVPDPDGSEAQTPAEPRLNVVVNWTEELKERVPVPCDQFSRQSRLDSWTGTQRLSRLHGQLRKGRQLRLPSVRHVR